MWTFYITIIWMQVFSLHLLGKTSFKYSWTLWAKWKGATSCWKSALGKFRLPLFKNKFCRMLPLLKNKFCRMSKYASLFTIVPPWKNELILCNFSRPQMFPLGESLSCSQTLYGSCVAQIQQLWQLICWCSFITNQQSTKQSYSQPHH